MSTSAPERAPRSDFERRVDSVAWASFFIWMGISLFANVGWGWFLVGAGAVVLAAQGVFQFSGGKLETGWLICGLVCLAAGLWEIFNLEWPLAPALLIVLGVGVLWQAFARS